MRREAKKPLIEVEAPRARVAGRAKIRARAKVGARAKIGARAKVGARYRHHNCRPQRVDADSSQIAINSREGGKRDVNEKKCKVIWVDVDENNLEQYR